MASALGHCIHAMYYLLILSVHSIRIRKSSHPCCAIWTDLDPWKGSMSHLIQHISTGCALLLRMEGCVVRASLVACVILRHFTAEGPRNECYH
ncbi:hypothetical protein BD310DRAFT_920558 [Dichomitus squalens]|uniref:Secreted protein n=1 Tax=Dichomitus squalens TaxID=114155 RepID=A0A4Q9Q358_9APHY|nr:hypothetical protein BD310DRAFT_920558 [Dichomitus squalens]